MDLSKLPKLSQTPPPPQQSPPPSPSPQPPAYAAPVVAQPSLGAEVWISAIVGIVLMLMGWGFARWAFKTLTGGTFSTGYIWPDGRPVGYWELQGGVAWTESGMFLLGLAFVLEAVALPLAVGRSGVRRSTVGLAFAITVAATIYNVIVVCRLFALGLMPLLSILGVGLGGYIAASQYRLLRAAGAQRPAGE